MPIIDGNYVAPIWKNNAQPAINMAELKAMCDTLELSPIKNGGTGGTTPETAREKLGAAETPKMVTVSLPAAGWVLTAGCYEQTVAVAGILATDTPATCRVEPVGNTDAAAQLLTDEAYGLCFTAGGYAACTMAGQLYCRCPKGGGKPNVNFNINVCMGR